MLSWEKVIYLRRKGYSPAAIAGAMGVTEAYVHRTVNHYAPELKIRQEGVRSHNYKDIPAGSKFGILTVLSFSHVQYTEEKCSAVAVFNVKCECGNTTKRIGTAMRTGAVKSCGCLRNKYFKGNTADKTKELENGSDVHDKLLSVSAM